MGRYLISGENNRLGGKLMGQGEFSPILECEDSVGEIEN